MSLLRNKSGILAALSLAALSVPSVTSPLSSLDRLPRGKGPKPTVKRVNPQTSEEIKAWNAEVAVKREAKMLRRGSK
jgi:hypothetical protein